jgi:hypothetical protein
VVTPRVSSSAIYLLADMIANKRMHPTELLAHRSLKGRREMQCNAVLSPLIQLVNRVGNYQLRPMSQTRCQRLVCSQISPHWSLRYLAIGAVQARFSAVTILPIYSVSSPRGKKPPSRWYSRIVRFSPSCSWSISA